MTAKYGDFNKTTFDRESVGVKVKVRPLTEEENQRPFGKMNEPPKAGGFGPKGAG